ncbi:SRPBCC family protein [Ferruginibacter sp. SUN002]|uniref:SRPBCC family protein n=1 Tax=Ferruginibacter sp. SUN002 TaxID=2937789 RepID=UPI003D367CF5
MAKEMIIEKSIVINKPQQEVFQFLKFIRNQDSFSVWNMKDPNKKTSSEGTDGSVGFIYSWDSKDKSVGAGSQQITKIIDGSRIEYELIFLRPMKNTGTSKFIIEPLDDNQTKVIWDFRGPTKFPMSLFKGIFQKMLGKDILQSLENLKTHLEK